jgi:SAM-dependent methyltransferase
MVTTQQTFWEQINSARWGQYLRAVEERGLREGSQLASTAVPNLREALDIGCEGGVWTGWLLNDGWQVTGTDIDPAALDVYRSRFPVHAVQADPDDHTLPCPDSSLSLVVCIQVHGVPTSPWFTSECTRMLAPGGVLVCMTWNTRSGRGLLTAALGRLRGRKSNRFYQTNYRAFRKSLIVAGFTVVSERGYSWFPLRRESNSRLVPLVAAAERRLGLSRWVSASPWVLVVAQRS